MYKCHLRHANVFRKFTCIGNDCEARQTFYNGGKKKVCKTLFVTVTILSPNYLLNDLLQNHCRYTSNDGKLSHDEGDISTPFLPLSVGFFLFKYVSTLLFALLT